MKLDQFLKWKNLVSSGGEAKIFIKSGSVKVNGVIETRRGRKLNKGDKVIFLKNWASFKKKIKSTWKLAVILFSDLVRLEYLLFQDLHLQQN